MIPSDKGIKSQTTDKDIAELNRALESAERQFIEDGVDGTITIYLGLEEWATLFSHTFNNFDLNALKMTYKGRNLLKVNKPNHFVIMAITKGV